MANTIRVYFDVTTLDDALLKTYVSKNQAIINESSEYIESFAKGMGVDANEIATPTPYKIAKLAEMFSYMTAAEKQATFSSGKEANQDSFSLKYELYRKRVADCEASITKLTFTNGVQAKNRRFPASMPMLRS